MFSSCSPSLSDPQSNMRNYSFRELVKQLIVTETEPVFLGFL